jgi:uncharacterized protein with PQ loop repeat
VGIGDAIAVTLISCFQVMDGTARARQRSVRRRTMLLTVPQVWSIWTTPHASGVSLVSWLAYLASSVAWLAYGIKKQDATICFANAGWIVMDLAIIIGILVRG